MGGPGRARGVKFVRCSKLAHGSGPGRTRLKPPTGRGRVSGSHGARANVAGSGPPRAAHEPQAVMSQWCGVVMVEEGGVVFQWCCDSAVMVEGRDTKKVEDDRVGIPNCGFVLVLTTRLQKVYEIMDLDLEIRMEDHLLPWELFCRNVGPSLVHTSSVIQQMAILLVKECHGNLLAIILLARALKGVTDIGVWDVALHKLTSQSSVEQVEEGISEVMVSFCGRANRYMDLIIPTKALSKLSELEELSIDVNPDDEWWDAEVKTILNELSKALKLKFLELYLPTVEILQLLRRKGIELKYPDWFEFRFIVGHHRQRLISRLPHEVEERFKKWNKWRKCLEYINGDGKPTEITEVLNRAFVFFLDRHWTIRMLSDFGNENLVLLRNLYSNR
ncbi:hypothetical protein HYC85_009913 [Camellia sinensis]|uniref:NB-ARC domain-containing protein n=1 Tax=Camellia sinensis TaxID=4442 RepID=A0A7J7HGY2_CAMSI|nr:hypothetical protein HYC85_009913 [Camellia sinensis]